MKPRSFVVASLLACALIGACSDDDEGGGTASAAYSVAGSLRQIPTAAVDDDNTSLVMSGDLDEASDLAGIERPEPDADIDEALAWVQAVTGVTSRGKVSDVAVMPLDAFRTTELGQIDAIRDELGWTMLDVTTYAGVDAPPEHFVSMTGTFDEATIDAAQGDRHDDIWSLGGDDFEQDLKNRTPARRLGESRRTALDDDRLAESVSTPTMRAWLSGKDTLADDDALVAVAEALDEHDVYSAALVPEPGASDDSASSSAGDSELAPFDGFGIGSAHDDDGAQAVLAYRCDDADGAEHNAEVLRALFEDGESSQTRQPWSELVTVDDVAVDGRMVVVTLDLLDRSPMLMLQAVFTREPFTISP